MIEALDPIEETIIKATRDLGYYEWLGEHGPFDTLRLQARFVAREIDDLLVTVKLLREQK